MDEQMVFGDRMIPVRLPDRTRFVPQGLSTSLPPVADLRAALQEALRRPLDLPPLRELARPGWKVTVAFDDPTVPCYGPVWEPAIRSVLEELEHAGVKKRDVTLLCANALHRKFTRGELGKVIGKELVREFGYRLLCHDAEDPENLSFLGITRSGLLIGNVLGPISGGFLAASLGMRLLFIFTGILFIAVTVVAARLVREQPP